MISSGLISVVLLFFLTRFLFKINRNNTMKSISNSYMSSDQNNEIKRNATESKSPIESVEHPIKMKNSFLNPNDDFGTLKKGVVLDNQTYEYEVNENGSSNFTIIELGDESEVKSG
jgi:hypothetical protein